MSTWIRTTLGDVVTFQRGFDITRSVQRDGVIPVVSSGGVSSFHDTAAATGPGVVIGRKGTLGKVFYLARDYWPHDTTLWVKDFKGNDPRFVYYFMTGVDVSWLDAGSANPTLNRNHLHPLAVVWPPLPEQQAIADVLGALDDKIAANTKLAATAEAHAVAILGSEHRSVTLGDVVLLHRRTVSPLAFGVAAVDHFSLPAFDAGALPEQSDPTDIKSAKFQLDRPVVLLSKLNPRIPRVWNVESLSGRPSLASTEFLVLEPLRSSTAVLWAALSQGSFAAALDAKVAGTSGSHQRVKPADALTTPVVAFDSISDVHAELITSSVTIASRLRCENRTLASTRDALLPQLMSGKLRVRDAEQLASGVL